MRNFNDINRALEPHQSVGGEPKSEEAKLEQKAEVPKVELNVEYATGEITTPWGIEMLKKKEKVEEVYEEVFKYINANEQSMIETYNRKYPDQKLMLTPGAENIYEKSNITLDNNRLIFGFNDGYLSFTITKTPTGYRCEIPTPVGVLLPEVLHEENKKNRTSAKEHIIRLISQI